MCEFFTENNQMYPGDSCINQLLFITHKIYKTFDDGLEVRGIFLEISKAFDRIWHKGLLHILKQSGISVKFFDPITNFIINYYYQRQKTNSCFKFTIFFMN